MARDRWLGMEQGSVAVMARLCAHGAGVGLLFGATLLLFDVGGLGALAGAAPQPATALIFLAGATFAFAPVVLCTAVARALGETKNGEHRSDG